MHMRKARGHIRFTSATLQPGRRRRRPPLRRIGRAPGDWNHPSGEAREMHTQSCRFLFPHMAGATIGHVRRLGALPRGDPPARAEPAIPLLLPRLLLSAVPATATLAPRGYPRVATSVSVCISLQVPADAMASFAALLAAVASGRWPANRETPPRLSGRDTADQPVRTFLIWGRRPAEHLPHIPGATPRTSTSSSPTSRTQARA